MGTRVIDDRDNLQQKTIKLQFGKRTTETQYVGNLYATVFFCDFSYRKIEVMWCYKSSAGMKKWYCEMYWFSANDIWNIIQTPESVFVKSINEQSKWGMLGNKTYVDLVLWRSWMVYAIKFQQFESGAVLCCLIYESKVNLLCCIFLIPSPIFFNDA